MTNELITNLLIFLAIMTIIFVFMAGYFYEMSKPGYHERKLKNMELDHERWKHAHDQQNARERYEGNKGKWQHDALVDADKRQHEIDIINKKIELAQAKRCKCKCRSK